MNFSEPSVKKRRLSTSQLGFIVGQLKACSGTNIPPTGNALDILSIDSSELLRLCDTQNIAVTYQDVQSLKVHVASTLLTSQSKDSLAEWSSSLPDLLSPLTHHPLPRQVFFGKAELDDLFPSLPHPSLLELLETKQEESYPGHAVCISHQVAMTLVVASAARGAKVLLLDTGIGTEIGEGRKYIITLTMTHDIHPVSKYSMLFDKQFFLCISISCYVTGMCRTTADAQMH